MDSSVCICGAGTMGRGIALAVAVTGLPVILYDLNPEMIKHASLYINTEIQRAFEKKRISADDKKKIQQAISYTSDIMDCTADIIIEAVVEKMEVKNSLFRELIKINGVRTIFATNTSSLPVTIMADQSGFSDRFIGLHFFNPANRMKLVEIIQTKYTSEETLSRIKSFVKHLHKTYVICKDEPGFIVNRVARPFYLEALRSAESQIADMTTIDQLMESAGFKMGPFHLMDLIGNDINYAVSQSLYEALDKPARLKPSLLQAEKVKTGSLGRKTGSGFFEYPKQASE